MSKGQIHSLLSPREIEVLRLVADGLTAAAIGHQLSISIWTVHNHIRMILVRLHAADRAQAVAMAMRAGVIE